MECISVFDMLKVGVGPSSSHTLGPWRAAQRWILELKAKQLFNQVEKIHIDLYGSLSLTGKGHATDVATLLGLCGHDPVTMDISIIDEEILAIKEHKIIHFNKELDIPFNFETDIKFNRKFLDFHPNGMIFRATLKNGKKCSSSFFSIGGGFVVKKTRKNAQIAPKLRENEVFVSNICFETVLNPKKLSKTQKNPRKMSENFRT